jgi:hypothetical protein
LGSCWTFISATGWTTYFAGAATDEGEGKNVNPQKNEKAKTNDRNIRTS